MDGCGDLVISSSVQMFFPGQKQVTCQDEVLAVLVHSGNTTDHLAILSGANICVFIYIFYPSNSCRRCFECIRKRARKDCVFLLQTQQFFFLNSD